MIDQILQNSSDDITIEIYQNGALSDPAGNVATVVIRDPNNVVLYDGVTATRESVGRYAYTLESAKTTLLGTYSAVWTFTINDDVTEHTQSFEIVSALETGYLLPDEYRGYTTMDVSTKINDDLEKYINRATSLVESYIGGSIRKKAYTEQVMVVIDYPNSGVHLQMKYAPIISVTSAVITFQPSSTVTLDVDNIRIVEDSGFLEYFGIVTPSALNVCISDLTESTIKPIGTVVYTAGYAQIPVPVERATTKLVDQLINLETKEFKDLSSLGVSNYSESYGSSDGKLGIGKIGGDEVVELLREYKHPIKRNIKIV